MTNNLKLIRAAWILSLLFCGQPLAANELEEHKVKVPSPLRKGGYTLYYGDQTHCLDQPVRLKETNAFRKGIVRDNQGRVRDVIQRWPSPQYLERAMPARFYIEPQIGITTFAGDTFARATFFNLIYLEGGLQVGSYLGDLTYYAEVAQGDATEHDRDIGIDIFYSARHYRLGARYQFPYARWLAIEEISIFGGPQRSFHKLTLRDGVTSIKDNVDNFGAFGGFDLAIPGNEMLFGLRATLSWQHVKADGVGLDDSIIQTHTGLFARFLVD